LIKWLPGLVPLLLVAVLFIQWKDWPPGPSTAGLDQPLVQDPGGPGPGDPDDTARLLPPVSKDSFASVIERPLFRPERRPEEPGAEEPGAMPEPDLSVALDSLDLSAVIITPTLVSAWVNDPSQPRLRRLRIGDDLEGWSVQEILPDRVLLERQGEVNALILRDYGKTPTTAPQMPIPRRPPRVLQRADPQDNDIQDQ
jgi:general secretion pathway protein N